MEYFWSFFTIQAVLIAVVLSVHTYLGLHIIRRNIIFTLCFGSLFLVGVGVEWSEAFRFFPPSTAFGTIFFTLTGFHAFHVLIGLLALLMLVLPGQRGRFTPASYWGAEGIIKFWHFVDVVWMFIFPTLYLVS